MPQLTYSLLMPTCNRAQLLTRFLDSVEKQTYLPKEIIVIDQSDTDETRKLFESWNPPAVTQNKIEKKYIYRKVKSLIQARNAGLDACGKTDLVAFFDDDLVLMPDFCEVMVKVFEENPKFGGGMGTMQGARYKPKPFQSFFFMPREGNGEFLPSGAPTLPHWRQEFCEVEFVSGGITFWKREIIQKYRYDERLIGYGYGDDVDVSYRISRDYPLFYQPKASCIHEDHSPGQDRARAYRRGWIQNFYYLAQKNGLSIPAYAWCVFGTVLRDAVCMDKYRLHGDFEGIRNIVLRRIDTVAGYYEKTADHRR